MQTLQTFIHHQGSVKAAAEALGLDRKTVTLRRGDGVVIDGKLYVPIKSRKVQDDGK